MHANQMDPLSEMMKSLSDLNVRLSTFGGHEMPLLNGVPFAIPAASETTVQMNDPSHTYNTVNRRRTEPANLELPDSQDCLHHIHSSLNGLARSSVSINTLLIMDQIRGSHSATNTQEPTDFNNGNPTSSSIAKPHHRRRPRNMKPNESKPPVSHRYAASTKSDHELSGSEHIQETDVLEQTELLDTNEQHVAILCKTNGVGFLCQLLDDAEVVPQPKHTQPICKLTKKTMVEVRRVMEASNRLYAKIVHPEHGWIACYDENDNEIIPLKAIMSLQDIVFPRRK